MADDKKPPQEQPKKKAAIPRKRSSHRPRDGMSHAALDSLWEVTSPRGNRWQPLEGVVGSRHHMGTYDPNDDAVWVKDGMDPHQTRETYLHEGGHRYDWFAGPQTVLDESRFAPYDAIAKNMRGILAGPAGDTFPGNATRPPGPRYRELEAINSVDDYWKSKPSEAYASSWGNAYDFLTRSQTNDGWGPGTDWRKELASREARYPGTGELVRELMQHPMFAKHRLRNDIRPLPEN